jgi:hypothetical protein
MLRASLLSFADVTDDCVSLLDREGDRVPCRLALRAKGIVGGTLRGVIFSNNSTGVSNDFLGDVMSLSMDTEL